MRKEIPAKTMAVIGVLIVAVLGILVWQVFFKSGPTSPAEIGIGAPALPGGGTVSPGSGSNPNGSGK